MPNSALRNSVSFYSAQAIRRGQVKASQIMDRAAEAQTLNELNRLLCVAADYTDCDITGRQIEALCIESAAA